MCKISRLKSTKLEDNFFFSQIDISVDNIVKYCMFSFTDGFLGYNQIKWHQKTWKKLYLSQCRELFIRR